jgi:hypothetical protein
MVAVSLAMSPPRSRPEFRPLIPILGRDNPLLLG